MNSKFKKWFEATPRHYPPKSIEDIDWDWDERHPIRRFYRQDPSRTILTLLALTVVVLSFSSGAFYFVFLPVLITHFLVMDYRDDYISGKFQKGISGEYWRLRTEKYGVPQDVSSK